MSETISEASVPDQSGRTILIKGANTAIGYEAVHVLAGRGARVLLGCRFADKASAARDWIRTLYPSGNGAQSHSSWNRTWEWLREVDRLRQSRSREPIPAHSRLRRPLRHRSPYH